MLASTTVTTIQKVKQRAINKEPLRIVFGLANCAFILTSLYALNIICGMDKHKSKYLAKMQFEAQLVSHGFNQQDAHDVK